MPAGGLRGAVLEAPFSPSLAVTSPCPWRTAPCGAPQRAPQVYVCFRCDGSARVRASRRFSPERPPGLERSCDRDERAARSCACLPAAATCCAGSGDGRMRRHPPSVSLALRGREPALKLCAGETPVPIRRLALFGVRYVQADLP